MRGFEKISKEEENEFVMLPRRSTSRSAGYDFCSPEDVIIQPNSSYIVKTGIKAFMMNDECLFIYPRSSVGIKHGVMLKNTVGVIDSDYYNNPDNEGEIMVALHNTSQKDYILKKGERFCQGVFQKILLSDEDVANDDTTNQKTRSGGIGSTGN